MAHICKSFPLNSNGSSLISGHRPPPSQPARRLKDLYWFKTIKWHLYKKYFGKPAWATRYIFDGHVRTLIAGDLVIDCGANLGTITRQLAAKGAIVHAFEPDPYTYSRLCENTAHLPNVVCHNKAVGVGRATVKLYRAPNFHASPDAASIKSSVFPDKLNVAEDNYVEVEQIDLVSFVTGLGRQVRLLKMDIEGAEVPLLEHMIKTRLLEKTDVVFAETHDTRIPSLSARTAKLRKTAEARFQGKLYLDWE